MNEKTQARTPSKSIYNLKQHFQLTSSYYTQLLRILSQFFLSATTIGLFVFYLHLESSLSIFKAKSEQREKRRRKKRTKKKTQKSTSTEKINMYAEYFV